MRFLFFTGFLCRFFIKLSFLAFSILSVTCSCNKPNNTIAPTPTSPTDTMTGGNSANQVKKNMLVRLGSTNPTSQSYQLTYDSSRHLKTVNGYRVYWKNDTIDHIISSSIDNGQTTVLSRVFVYNSNRQCYKVLTKTKSSWTTGDPAVADTNPFFSDPNDGQFIHYDSLVYLPSGQLSELWTTDWGKFIKSLTFQYNNAQSAAPYKLQFFGLNTSGDAAKLYYELALTTNATDHPVYNALWFMPLLHSTVSVMPSNVTGFTIYMPLIKKCVTQWMQTNYKDGGYESGSNYIYYYNSDSTLFTGRLEPDDPGFYRVIYGFQKL